MNIFAGNSMWQLILQSDATGKLVLLVLFGMSVLCWAIFLGKLLIFCLKNKQFNVANKKLRNVKNITQLSECASSMRNSAPGHFLVQNLAFLHEVTNGNYEQKMSETDWLLIEKNCDNTLETMILENEFYLPILSTSAAVATLLGLFGTVWGLVHAFMRISETQVADIATIAPGIAEALITTLAGLIVAIPAFVMFNYLQTHFRRLEHTIIVFADRMMFVMQQLRER